MATIEERAYRYAVKTDKPYSWFCDLEKSYIAGAKEQDRIARNEERERCIRLAQDVFCWMKCNKTNEGGVCYAKDGSQEHCFWYTQIRKAMEGGEG